MKKVLPKVSSLFLAIMLVCASAPLAIFEGIDVSDFKNVFSLEAEAVTDSGKCGDNLTWTFDESTGELVISGNGEMYYFNDPNASYSIPWNNYHSSVKTIKIGASVTLISTAVFNECENLKKISVDRNNKYFSNDNSGALFDKNKTFLYQFPIGNKVSNYSIPGSVNSIADCAFNNLHSLKEITIPSSLDILGYSVFSGCLNLKDVYFLGTQNQWNKINFSSGNDELTSATIHFEKSTSEKTTKPTATKPVNNSDSLSGKCGDNLTWTFDKSTGELVINGTGDMTSWTDSPAPWYSYCSYIDRIIIGNSVTSIGDNAFSACDSITSLSIPASVIKIGKLSGCFALEKITVDKNNNNYSSDSNGVLFNKSKTVLIKYPENSQILKYSIPNSVTKLQEDAFLRCSVDELTIPNSVTSIGEDCFWNFASKKIIVSKDNKYFSSDKDGALFNKDKTVFLKYPSLSEKNHYSVPSTVKTISTDAFRQCDVTSLSIPASVTKIEDSSFIKCFDIHDIYYGGTQEQWKKIAVGEYNDDLTSATVHFADNSDISISESTSEETVTENISDAVSPVTDTAENESDDTNAIGAVEENSKFEWWHIAVILAAAALIAGVSIAVIYKKKRSV